MSLLKQPDIISNNFTLVNNDMHILPKFLHLTKRMYVFTIQVCVKIYIFIRREQYWTPPIKNIIKIFM